MDATDALAAVIQAHGLAICALLSTHPRPDELRTALATLTAAAPSPNQGFQMAIATFEKAIPPH